MGIIRKTVYTGALTAASVVGYLGATTTVVSPLPRDDPIFSSRSYAKYNAFHNPSTQDVVFKRIPLGKIRPELLQNEGALALEMCRGVWSGLAYLPQRLMLQRKYRDRPETATHLWTAEELSKSTYEPGTLLTNHFEVVEKTPYDVFVRSGDSPANPGPRDSDGLFVISADVDKERQEAIVSVKSCFFISSRKVEGIQGPMPGIVEELHRWYARALLAAGARKLLR